MTTTNNPPANGSGPLPDRLLFTSLMEGALHLPFFSGSGWAVGSRTGLKNVGGRH